MVTHTHTHTHTFAVVQAVMDTCRPTLFSIQFIFIIFTSQGNMFVFGCMALYGETGVDLTETDNLNQIYSTSYFVLQENIIKLSSLPFIIRLIQLQERRIINNEAVENYFIKTSSTFIIRLIVMKKLIYLLIFISSFAPLHLQIRRATGCYTLLSVVCVCVFLFLLLGGGDLNLIAHQTRGNLVCGEDLSPGPQRHKHCK